MELAAPSIDDAFAALADAGCATIICHPFFLSEGRHVRDDVPALLEAAAAKHPGVAYTLTPPLGAAPALLDLMHGVVGAAVAEATAAPAQEEEFGFFGGIAAAIAAAEAEEGP